jgi:6-pyruvoyltetrahydropterin/6-carboxytetrahydropterin synthase
VLTFRPREGYLDGMYSVRVEADFAAAHFLSHYHGKCENLHGHNYRVNLWISGKDLDEGGMLVDFGAVKKILRGICSSLDHSNLNDLPVFKNDPSAERIAEYIYNEAAKKLRVPAAVLLRAVEVYETPTSVARYEPDSIG